MFHRASSFLFLLIAASFALSASAQTQSTPQNFSRNLRSGDSGADVSALQSFLIADGFLSVPSPTSYFGAKTTAALEKWQATNGLPGTGFFGPLSRAAISSSSPISTPLSAPTTASVTAPSSPSPTPVTPTPSPYDRNLKVGDTGVDVYSLQSFLIANGFLGIPGPTGRFGAMTSAALAEWQTIAGLPASGYFGPLSRAAIETPQGKSIATAPAPTPTPTPTPAPVVSNIGTGGGGGGAGGGGGNPSSPSTPAPSAPPPSTPAAPPSVPSNPSDTSPPSVPSGLTATAVSATQINLSWTASTDNVGVVGYKVFQNGMQVTTTTATSYQSTGLAPSTPYSYVVSAFDAAGNVSAQSLVAGATTLASPDVTPPTISLTNPANNATVSSTITLAADASDNVGVTSVQFTLDGVNLGAPVTASLYQAFWNTLSASIGTHTLGAIAKDAAGNTGTAGNITVTVVRTPTDTTPPTIFITSPVTSSTVSAPLTVNVTASDNVGVARVELYVDGNLRSTATGTPYAFPLATTTLTLGTHILTGKAYDAAGNFGATSAVVITVVRPFPTVPLNLAVTGTTSSSISLSWSSSTEVNGAIAGYKIYRGGVQTGTSTITSFTNTNLTASTTYSYAVAAYDAAGATSATSTTVTTSTLAIPPATSNFAFGIAAGSGLPYLGQSDLLARLQAIKNLGVGWVRFDVDWSIVQQSGSSSYDWSSYDPIVADLNTLGLKGLGIITYAPQWALPANCLQSNKCAPADPAQFAAFAVTAARRYAPQGMHTWEIWNEPNLKEFWQPAPDVNAYTNLLKGAYTAIKGQDPSAIILSGGLSGASTQNGDISPVDFLTQLYADGGKPYFDAVADHPYSYPAMPLSFETWNAWSQMASTTPNLRNVMIANGDTGKQIWLTEYGAPTGGPGVLETSATDTTFAGSPDHVTEALQAQMLSQAVNYVKNSSWAGPFFWYSYEDVGTSTSDSENFFGIIRYDGSTKPSYQVFKNLLQ